MSNAVLAVIEHSPIQVLRAAEGFGPRIKAVEWALEAVEIPDFKFPVPRLFADLPWANADDGSILLGILAKIGAAEDITQVQDEELRDPMDILKQPCEVFGVRAMKSDLDDSNWGAYVSITVSVDGAEPEVINTGAGEVCVVMWRLFCDAQLPMKGYFDVKGEKVKGRSQPITFHCTPDF